MSELRECVESALRDSNTDVELLTKLIVCMHDAQNLPDVDPYASIQRGDTEEYNPDNETNEQERQPDQMIGGKKSRRRRHRHKSRRNRRKSHKRK